MRTGKLTTWLCCIALLSCGQGSSGDAAVDHGVPDGATRGDAAVDHGVPDGATSGDANRGPGSDVISVPDAPHVNDAGPPPPMTCPIPIMALPTTGSTVVGTGTAASCTAAALATAVQGGGTITFNCGGAATIALTQEITVPTDRDTVIDGGSMITLDGSSMTRILHFESGDYRGMYGGPQHVLTVQNIAFANAKASGTPIALPSNAPAACSTGTGTDGGGGAILMVSGILHVIDATFTNDAAAPVGPDVAGGAINAQGSTDVTVVGSRFAGCSASNGGAMGMLNSDLTLVNDTFMQNAATGNGANTIDTTMCPMCINGGEVGNGGNAGAVGVDGGDDGTLTICGCTFSHNSSNALAGAFGRTPDNATQTTNIDQSTFDSNSSMTGGGAIYIHNSILHVTNSTFSNNSAPGAGAIQADGTQFEFTNDTLTGNTALGGVGGAFSVFNSASAGTLTNCTVANNQALGMNYGAFAAASFGSSFVWNNCLIANNTDNDNNSMQSCQTAGTGSDSLQWPQMASTGPDPACAAGISYADPMLGTLGDNGGPTQTMVPAAAASVIQIGTNCPGTDQTGHARATPCTAGAVEAM